MAQTYTCAVTRMRIRGPHVLPGFLRHSTTSMLAARRTPGVARVRLLGFPLLPWYFTLTVWESEAAMRAFVTSPAHRVAMSHMDDYARRASFAIFTSSTRRVSWRRAFRALRTPSGVYPAQPAPASAR